MKLSVFGHKIKYNTIGNHFFIITKKKNLSVMMLLNITKYIFLALNVFSTLSIKLNHHHRVQQHEMHAMAIKLVVVLLCNRLCIHSFYSYINTAM